MDYARVARARQMFASGRARKIREDAGLSIRELAAFAGVPRASLASWETGAHAPRGDAAIRWLDAVERLG